jgi:hypothetical protein
MASAWRSAACVRAADDSRAAAESVGEGMGRLSGISAVPARVCVCVFVCLDNVMPPKRDSGSVVSVSAPHVGFWKS